MMSRVNTLSAPTRAGSRAVGASIAAVLLLASCAPSPDSGSQAEDANAVTAPVFEVDPLWPKPLPNHWLLGTVIGVDVDDEDNVWIVHRGSSLDAKEVYATWDPPASYCCFPAPPVLVFSQSGELVQHWGGPGEGYDWPASNHGIDVDHKGMSGSGATVEAGQGPKRRFLTTRAQWARAACTTAWC